jgi:DNA repair protein RecO (recombination protein O)
MPVFWIGFNIAMFPASAVTRRRGGLFVMGAAGLAGAVAMIGAELAGSPVAVAPSCLMSGFYMNELVLKLMARVDPHPDIHEAYALSLASLADPGAEHRALRLFEKRLLDALGLGLDYSHLAADGTRVEPDRYYHVDPERGVTGPAGRPDAPGACLGAELLALAGEELAGTASLATARRLLGAALAAALDGRELSSRKVARAVRSVRAGTEER